MVFLSLNDLTEQKLNATAMPFSPEGQYQRSERQEYIHTLIGEFREQLTKGGYEIPKETDGVVALSAPPEKLEDRFLEKTDENVARIDFAIQAITEVTAERTGKPLEDITAEDIITHGPPLVLNGETEQLPMMREVALSLDFPQAKIEELDCGKRGIGNTKTQFTTLDTDPRFADNKHWTFVSTGYHVPRVARTAMTNISTERDFDVIGVPLEQHSYDVYRKVRGEVKRIVAYSAKGDIAK